jgi:hypothetical protein
MRAKLSMVVSTMLLLSACGGGKEQQAANACDAAVKDKVAGRGYEMSVKELASSAKAEGDAIRVSAPIVFDKGLTSEYKQVLDCRVRFEAGKSAPTVIFLQFNWATEDLKPQ